MEISKTIGKNLLALRKNAKLTQMELADIFNYSDKSISKWETGESLPSIETLYELCVFYGVTLDSLTQEEMKINEPPKKSIKDKLLLPARLAITLLAVSAVWLVATVLFVSFKIALHKNLGMFFLWAVPISGIVLLIFNSIWGRKYLLFYLLSIIIWSTITCVYVQLLQYRLWMLYLLGIPLQVAVILWAAIIYKPHKKKQAKIKPIKPEKATRQKGKQKTPKQIVELKPVEQVKNENTNEIAEQEKQSTKTKKQQKKHNDDDDFGFDYIQNKK